tara:strand:- start:819 stop:1403 length:585 start_codon:yes stop_codon:yes gene_type:complete
MYRSSFSELPPVVKNILIINCLIFFAQTTIFPLYNFYLWPVLSENFNLYQLITYSFLHGSMSHLFFNMFALYMFGRILENTWGSKRFLNFYLLTAICAGIIQLLVEPSSPTIGASGAVFGLLAGFGTLFPNTKLFLLFPPIPIKAKYFVLGYACLELLNALSVESNIAHWAHLGGAIAGYFIIQFWRKNNSNFY